MLDFVECLLMFVWHLWLISAMFSVLIRPYIRCDGVRGNPSVASMYVRGQSFSVHSTSVTTVYNSS